MAVTNKTMTTTNKRYSKSFSKRFLVGFTLVELSVGLAIGTILGLGMMELMRGGSRMFHGQGQQLEALQSAMMVSEIIKEDFGSAVLPGISRKDPDSGKEVPDYRPFKFDADLLKDGKVPVGIVEPIDIGEGGQFIFFKTVAEDSPEPVDPLLDIPNPDIGVSQPFEPEKGYKLIAVRYSAGRLKTIKIAGVEKKYFSFKREEIDPDGTIAASKTYNSFRLKKLVFFTVSRDWDNIKGLDGFSAPSNGTGSVSDTWKKYVMDPTAANAGSVLGAVYDAIKNMVTNGNNSNSSAGSTLPRDQCYYVQFFVTGLSSRPVKREFLDFTENTLMHIMSFDALTEKVRTENGAMYWNDHAAADGYLTTGTFSEPWQ